MSKATTGSLPGRRFTCLQYDMRIRNGTSGARNQGASRKNRGSTSMKRLNKTWAWRRSWREPDKIRKIWRRMRSLWLTSHGTFYNVTWRGKRTPYEQLLRLRLYLKISQWNIDDQLPQSPPVRRFMGKGEDCTSRGGILVHEDNTDNHPNGLRCHIRGYYLVPTPHSGTVQK